MQDGYMDEPSPVTHSEVISNSTPLPLRAIAPGLHMGISVLMDVHKDDYYCSGTESVGFKVHHHTVKSQLRLKCGFLLLQSLLHTPVTLPEMIEYGFAIHPGTETFLSVTPSALVADKTIHGFSRDKRQCYLRGEKELAYFRDYTFLNCFMECSTNFTFSKCGCVAYFMPRNPLHMPICAPEKSECVITAMTEVEESAYDGSHSTNLECRCLESCTEMDFPHETSVSKLDRAELINVPHNMKGKPLYNHTLPHHTKHYFLNRNASRVLQ